MQNQDLVNAIVGSDDNGKCKTLAGFFIETDIFEGNESIIENSEPKDTFYVEKPIIDMSEYSDADGIEYYSFEFMYRSRRDEDLRGQWQFMEQFVSESLGAEEKGTARPSMIVNLIPKSLDGEYSIMINGVIPDSIIKVEYAGDNSCAIRMLVYKENVLFLQHDRDLVNMSLLEDEVIGEIDAEMVREYGRYDEDNMDR